MKKAQLLGAMAASAVFAAASIAVAEETTIKLEYDLAGISYFAGNHLGGGILNDNLIIEDFIPSLAGAVIVDAGYKNLSVVVADNTGAGAPFEAWASELRIGYYYPANVDGGWGEGVEFTQPFPGINQDGAHGPASASGWGWQGSPPDVINEDGRIAFYAWNSWNDGTGLAHGEFTGGTIWIEVKASLPTPGALALLGLAGLVGVRRRRS